MLPNRAKRLMYSISPSMEIISYSVLKILPLFALTESWGSTDQNSNKNFLKVFIDWSYFENLGNSAEDTSAIDFVFQKLTHFSP